MTLAAQWGTGQVLLSMIWFFLFFIWIWLLISVFGDVVASRDMGGWAKAGWCIFVIVLPILGVLVYLIARGGKMHDNAVRNAQDADNATRAYIRDVVKTTPGPADQVAQLNELKNQGVIDEDEFQRLKAKVAV
ncbi:MAG TPA: SHOCT domain-containing protein [Acidimicrobiia bacterium]